jgi:glycosyltransferase involved in cell wall biosynthesis
MPKIVIYKDFFRSGRGADRATATLANSMSKIGYDVHVVTQQPAKEPLSVTFESGVTCHNLPNRKRSFVRTINKLLLSSAFGERILEYCLPKLDEVRVYSRRLQALITDFAPDIVVAAGTNECVDLLLAGPLEPPVVVMFHVFPPECFRKNKFRRASRLKAVLPRVAACQVLQPSYCSTLYPYAPRQVVPIGNGVSYPIDEAIPTMDTRDKSIVYVAYFSKDKNHLELLEAFARLNAPEWTLHLYGSGTPEWETRLKARAIDLGIDARVRFMGITHTPRPILLHAGICAFPSKVEGFSLALAEAMWCGLPCVGFKNSPGVNDVIAHEANGLLAEPGPEAFAEQLQRLIDDEALRAHLGEVAARTARRTWSQAAVVQRWDDLFQGILHQKDSSCIDDAIEGLNKNVEMTY